MTDEGVLDPWVAKWLEDNPPLFVMKDILEPARSKEIVFPVTSPQLVSRLKQILQVYLADEAKGRYLNSDGSYVRSPKMNDAEVMNSQAWLLSHPDAQ